MQTRSETWAALAIRGRFKMEARAVINGTTYTTISAPVIDRALFSGALSVGNCNAASLKFDILTTDTIPAGASVVIQARISSGSTTSEWRTFGTFFIDSREVDEVTGMTSLQCYDAMMKTNQLYVDPTAPNARLGWPKTMAVCVAEIAQRIGVQVDSRTVIKTGDAYQVPYPAEYSQVSDSPEDDDEANASYATNYTMNQVLGFIGACHGGNWVITPENKLRLVPMVAPPAETFDIIDHDYNKILTSEGYKLVWQNTASGETVTNAAGGDLLNVPIAIGSIETMRNYSISKITMTGNGNAKYSNGSLTDTELTINCPYSRQAICDDLYAAFGGLEYRPFTITNACYDPCAELGDWILAGDKVRSFIAAQTCTFGNEFRANVSAPGSKEGGSEYPYLTAIERLNLQTENLRLYTEAARLETYSVIEQTRDSILLGVYAKLADEYVAYSDITITTSGITLAHGSAAAGNLYEVSFDMSDSGIAMSYQRSADGGLISGTKDIITSADFTLGENGISMNYVTRDAHGMASSQTIDFLSEASFTMNDNGIVLTYDHHDAQGHKTTGVMDFLTASSFVMGNNGITLNYNATDSRTGQRVVESMNFSESYLTEANFSMTQNGITLTHTKSGQTVTKTFDSTSYLVASDFTMTENGITLSHTSQGQTVTKSLSTASYLTTADFTMGANGITLRHGTETKSFDSSSYLTSADFTMTANGITLSHGTTTKSFDSSSYLTSADFTMGPNGITLSHGTTTKSFNSSSYLTAADFTMDASGITLTHGTTTKSMSLGNYVTSSSISANANGIYLSYTKSGGTTTGSSISVCDQIVAETSKTITIGAGKLIINSGNFQIDRYGTVTATGYFRTSGVSSGGVTYSCELSGGYLKFFGGTADAYIGMTTQDNVTIRAKAVSIHDGSSSGIWVNYNDSGTTYGALIAGGLRVSTGGIICSGETIFYSEQTLYGGTTVYNGLTVSTGGVEITGGGKLTFGNGNYLWYYSNGGIFTDGNFRANGNIVADDYMHTEGNITSKGNYIWLNNSGGKIQSEGDIYAAGDMWCSGTKSRIVDTPDYGMISLYAMESATPMFSDLGSGTLDENGVAYIWFDPDFMETVELRHEYQVFLTQTSAGAVQRAEKHQDYFIVYGAPGASFDWIAYCRQRDYESLRLEMPSDDLSGPVEEEEMLLESVGVE